MGGGSGCGGDTEVIEGAWWRWSIRLDNDVVSEAVEFGARLAALLELALQKPAEDAVEREATLARAATEATTAHAAEQGGRALHLVRRGWC